MMGRDEEFPNTTSLEKENESRPDDIVDGSTVNYSNSDENRNILFDSIADATPHNVPSVDSIFEDDDSCSNTNDDETINAYLDRELDREISEMIQTTQKQLDDELRKLIDEQLQAELDQQMENHFATLEHAFQRHHHHQKQQDRHEDVVEGGAVLYKQQQELIGSVLTNLDGGSMPPVKPTVADINTQIEEIISRYAATVNLGSSDHTKLGNQSS
jgi:hypothetical protein